MNAPLDPLSDFRSDGYGLDDARRARMRARVLDAIPDDPIVRDAGPVATAVRVEPRRTPDIDLTGAQTLEAVPADGSNPRLTPSKPHWSTGRRLLVAAAIATVIGLMAVVAGTSRSSDRRVGTLDGSSAATTLDDLALVAGSHPDKELAPGQYQYVQTSESMLGKDGIYDVTVDDSWHTVDGSGRRETRAMVGRAGPFDERAELSAPSLRDDSAGLPFFGPFDYGRLQGAPTDPTALRDAIRLANAGQPDSAVATQIAALEALTTTPSRVRVAGFKVLDQLGYRPVGQVTDPLGRTGVGFQLETDQGIQVLAFDPDTGRALGFWNSPSGGPATVQTATHWMAWANDAVTDGSS